MTYELTIALKSDLAGSKAKEIVEDVERAAKEVGGSVEKVESVGIKPLSYPIRGAGQASFSRFMVQLSPDQATGFQKELARHSEILRVLMIKGEGGKNG